MIPQAAAITQLALRCESRMRRLARRLLCPCDTVELHGETEETLEEAALRLHVTLRDLIPQSDLQLHRLACLHVRRVLIDLCRQHAERIVSVPQFAGRPGLDPICFVAEDVACFENDFLSADFWSRFHETTETLPEMLRDVVDLLWYEGLGQTAAAELLGISPRSLRRRWRAARVLLMRELAEEFSV